jgi:hypothetical protein
LLLALGVPAPERSCPGLWFPWRLRSWLWARCVLSVLRFWFVQLLLALAVLSAPCWLSWLVARVWEWLVW